MTIMIRPVVSEKATQISEKNNRFTFRVSPDANKHQIKDAVEKLYDVKVTGVSTMNYEGKRKQRYPRRGLQRGKMSAFKKAVVTVAQGQTIDFYSNL